MNRSLGEDVLQVRSPGNEFLGKGEIKGNTRGEKVQKYYERQTQEVFSDEGSFHK